MHRQAEGGGQERTAECAPASRPFLRPPTFVDTPYTDFLIRQADDSFLEEHHERFKDQGRVAAATLMHRIYEEFRDGYSDHVRKKLAGLRRVEVALAGLFLRFCTAKELVSAAWVDIAGGLLHENRNVTWRPIVQGCSAPGESMPRKRKTGVSWPRGNSISRVGSAESRQPRVFSIALG